MIPFRLTQKKLEFKKIRQNTMKITNSDIQELTYKIKINKEKIGEISKNKFIDILGTIDNVYIDSLKDISNFVGVLDVYKSAAKTSIKYGYTRPIRKGGV